MISSTVYMFFVLSLRVTSAWPASADGLVMAQMSLHDDGGLIQIQLSHKSDGVDLHGFEEESIGKVKKEDESWAAKKTQSMSGISNNSFDSSDILYDIPKYLQPLTAGGPSQAMESGVVGWLRCALVMLTIVLTLTCMFSPSTLCCSYHRHTSIYWAQLSKIYSMKFPEHTHAWQGEADATMTPYGQALKNAYHVINVNKPPAKMPEYPDAIESLRNFTDLNKEDMQKQWTCYFNLVKERESVIKMLKRKLGDEWLVGEPGPEAQRVWGSSRQYASAVIVVEKLLQRGHTEIPLHPCFGVLLLPTLGAAEGGSTSALFGGVGSPTVVNACVHDAFGYLCFYHRACLGHRLR